ncbi:MAG: hypothetical protein OXI48_04405 [bacterium]|nr:hypothetical protein [bacterium]
MSGGELAVVLASVAVVVAAAVLGAVGVSLSRSLKELRRLLGEIRRDLLPAVERIEAASGQVTGEVRRVGGLLDVAEATSERADALSRVTYRALVEPLAAVASIFRRGAAAETAASADTTTSRAAAAGGGRSRQPPWSRRLAVSLLRSGYRTAAVSVAAGLARSIREVTREIASAAAEGRRTPRDDGRAEGGTGGRPE